MERLTAHYPIQKFLDLRANQMLIVNLEYQRGQVWSLPQKKRLIDSVLRGYPLPVIYLHRLRQEVGDLVSHRLEVIDGQQRLDAIYEFYIGAFPLFDPVRDEAARFPRFLQEQECPWANQTFDTLPKDLKKQFVETKLPVAEITSENQDEVRDLFVRLQAGLPLSPQEKRDALPGGFNEFVLRLGGKPGTAYPGQPFFGLVTISSPHRGGVRTLAAQIAMLFLTRREGSLDSFTDISAGEIDDYYYHNLDFDASAPDCQRLIDILDRLNILLGDQKRPKLRAHIAIHLVLFLDDIWDSYTPAWQGSLASAIDGFVDALAQATRAATLHPDEPNDYWQLYGQWARTGTNSRVSIERRHRFFVEQMHGLMGGALQAKDTKRAFGELDRQIIYYRDAKRCQVCNGEAAWDDTEIHHVVEHYRGGRTALDNGALVHRSCHPRGDAAEAFAKEWEARR